MEVEESSDGSWKYDVQGLARIRWQFLHSLEGRCEQISNSEAHRATNVLRIGWAATIIRLVEPTVGLDDLTIGPRGQIRELGCQTLLILATDQVVEFFGEKPTHVAARL